MNPERRPDAAPDDPLAIIAPWGQVLVWRLPVLMANAGFRFATQLHEALRSEGIELSYGHVNRLTKQAPERLTVHVQFALCRILDCSADDLWGDGGEVAAATDPVVKTRARLKDVKPVRARGLE